MKRILKFLNKSVAGITILTIFLFSHTSNAQVAPFNKGVNLTNWFQADGARQIQFTRYTKEDFENIKSLGCDVIRLPINLHYMTDGEPNYSIDPLFFDFLDQVVDWSEELEMNLILDNHTFDPASNTDPNVGNILEKVWMQMAEHYKDRSELIYYEILNEPHGISESLWNSIQQDVVAKIREIDTKHTIIIGAANWNSYNTLKDMPVYEDDNLIYTFHFYDPFIFTHQGASWTDPSMVPLAGVPFPYQEDEMPVFPEQLEGSWLEGAFNDYENTGNIEEVKSLIDIAVEFKNERDVTIFCGEFGVYIPNSDNEDRVAWYDSVSTYLTENGIPWTSWDYHGGFGIFEGGSGQFDHDLNIPLLEAMGFNTPEQTEYIQKPDSTGFVIYDDFIGEDINGGGNTDGTMDFYSQDLPNNGKFDIFWTGATQYNAMYFDFEPNKDLSKLVEEDYALDFFVRGAGSAFTFDVRFLDTDTEDPEDHPWRIRYTIEALGFDSLWHHMHIPLSEFTEQGAWEDEWFEPEGKFDWSAIDRFEIVTEHEDMNGGQVWFDNIIVTNQDTAQVLVNNRFPEREAEITGFDNELKGQIKIYPNPTENILNIDTGEKVDVHAQLLDGVGRSIHDHAFVSNTTINLSGLPDGVYILKLKVKNINHQQYKIIKR